MKKNLLVFLCLLMLTNMQAQSFLGFVQGNDGVELPFATLAIYEKGTLQEGMYADEAGTFELQNMNWDTLEVHFLGYETAKVPKNSFEKNGFVELKKQTFNLTEVVVVEERGPIYHCILRCCAWGEEEIPSFKPIFPEHEELPITEWTIFPNPTTDFVQFKSNEILEGVLEIYDMQGQRLSAVQITQRNQVIDLQDLPTGTYILRNRTKEKIIPLGKIVKVNQ